MSLRNLSTLLMLLLAACTPQVNDSSKIYASLNKNGEATIQLSNNAANWELTDFVVFACWKDGEPFEGSEDCGSHLIVYPIFITIGDYSSSIENEDDEIGVSMIQRGLFDAKMEVDADMSGVVFNEDEKYWITFYAFAYSEDPPSDEDAP